MTLDVKYSNLSPGEKTIFLCKVDHLWPAGAVLRSS